MSPFAEELRRTRFTKGLRQTDLAQLMGCERSFISALENDLKGAPPEDFVERLGARLGLSAAEVDNLKQARARSQRRFVVPVDAPPATFEFVYELFSRLGRLTEQQLLVLRGTLDLGPTERPAAVPSDGRLRRRDRKQTQSEGLS